MCGITGIIYKNARQNGQAPVGRDLIRMLDSLAHRGRDSTGVTIAGRGSKGAYIVRLWTDDEDKSDVALEGAEEAATRVGCVVTDRRSCGRYLRLLVNYEGEVSELAEALIATMGIEIHSIGQVSEVVKDVGTAGVLSERHSIGDLRGTHGIGHVRMATESKVDISHAHPFWAYPFPDVTVVHNGQLTNYHNLKRRYQGEGHRFQTGNDSELIAVYLADKLASGKTLEKALSDSLNDLDGTFTYVVSTKEGLGYAKDQWSAKPLVTMETEDVVAIASEEVALRSVFSDEINRVEPQQREYMTWSL